MRAHHLLPPTLASIPVPGSPSSSPTCLPRMHQVPAHLRLCAFDPFYASLSSLPRFFFSAFFYHLWTHCSITHVLFIPAHPH